MTKRRTRPQSNEGAFLPEEPVRSGGINLGAEKADIQGDVTGRDKIEQTGDDVGRDKITNIYYGSSPLPIDTSKPIDNQNPQVDEEGSRLGPQRPFKIGLNSFDITDSEIFLGRDEQVKALISLIDSIVVFCGIASASSCGSKHLLLGK